MAFDYTGARDTADRLIANFGQTVTIRRKSTSGPDYNPTVSTADHTATGVVLDYDNRLVDGQMIQSSDKRVFIKAGSLGVTPDPTTDTLIVGSESHQIVQVKPLSPGGTVLFYELQIRG